MKKITIPRHLKIYCFQLAAGAAVFGALYALLRIADSKSSEALLGAGINAALFVPPWGWIAENAPERGADSGGGYYYEDDDFRLPAINPATGLPMAGPGTCGVDVGGHTWGSSD